MANKKRIDNTLILRNQKEESAFGIKNLNLYAYMDDRTLKVIGEIRADKVIENYYFLCTAYDEDGDIIASHENKSYGGSGLVTNRIKAKSFYDGFPFEINVSIPDKTTLGKIRIEPKR